MDFNINTTQAQANQAGDLDAQGNFLGDSLGMNALKQQEQAELVKQAVERSKQAQLSSKQKTEADDEGVNPETADYISKDEALTYIMHEWKVDETDPEIQHLKATLPDMVARQMIQTLIRKRDRLSGKAVGQPFKAEQRPYPTSTDGTGDAKLQVGQMYQAYVNDDDGVSYIPSGETPAAIRHEGSDDKQDHKDWLKLVYDMDATGASSRKALGINYSSYVAAIRGENLLNQPVVTGQNVAEVTRDLTRILQQGVPTDAGSSAMEYHSLMGDIAKKLQYWGGKPKNALPPEDKLYLEDSFKRLKAVSLDVIDTKIRHMEAGFPDLIAAHRDEWSHIVDNLLHPPTSNMDSYVPSTPPANSPGMFRQVLSTLTGTGSAPVSKPVQSVDNSAPAQTKKTASGVTYTVSE